MVDTPTAPIRALAREKQSALQSICALLLTALGLMSGVVWTTMSNTVAAQGLRIDRNGADIGDQKARLAVLEAMLPRIERILEDLQAQRRVATAGTDRSPP